MTNDFYHLALDTLRRHLEEADCDFSEDEGELAVGSHRIGLSVSFDGFATQGNHRIAPLDVQIHFDGDAGDKFRVGTLGVGSTETEAMVAAVEEWHVLAAAPVLAAMGAEAGTPRRQASQTMLAGWHLFPGRAGVRGEVPAGLQAGGAFFGVLLGALRETVATWEEPDVPTFRSLFVMAGLGGAEGEMQGAVDGFVNEQFVGKLAELPWPESKEAYFYKQLFVLRSKA